MSVFAKKSANDSIPVINLGEVAVTSIRANQKTPMAFTNITKAEIAKNNFGQDIPYLLSMSPSVLTTSDAGTGIGYTSLRVRGTDGTRINITANGIPLNDAESHVLYWVDMPDLASSLKDIQVQRGAGTSTNGGGAFGGSVNMLTEQSSNNSYAEINGSYGSFNTHKETIKLGSGLLNNHWAVDLRLSNIGSDGYIDRASSSLYSYFAQAAYYGNKFSIKALTFGGTEKTYMAWYYASKDEMAKYGRKYNSAGIYTDSEGKTQFYKDQNDNYFQRNYQVIYDHFLSKNWTLNIGIHYTKGDGFYQEYKTDRTLKEYGLTPFINAQGETVKNSDLIRKKILENNFGGGIFSINYKKGRLDAVLGGAMNYYDGWHYGEVLWVRNYAGGLNPNQRYYSNDGRKLDANIYGKATYDIWKGLSAYVDLQYRHVDYKISGQNDNYDYNVGAMQMLDVHDKFNFFNPKAGLNWNINKKHRVYASFSIAQKEPTRENYTDGILTEYPKSEKLYDYEAGYSFANKWLTAGANLYYMNYTNQLVPTGQLNDVGKAMMVNVPKSYRMGVELMAGVHPVKWFQWDINATLSRNRIKNFVEVIYEDEWTNPIDVKCGNTPIAFSPDFLLNNRFSFLWNGFEAGLQTQYVSKQYMTNAKVEEQTLDSYFVSNLNLGYTFTNIPNIKNLRLGFVIYNIFNEEYENNGYAGSGYTVSKDGKKEIYRYSGYAAQAGTNVMGSISLKF